MAEVLALLSAQRLFLGLALLTSWGSEASLGKIAHPRGLAARVDLSFLLKPLPAAALGILYCAASAAFVLGWRQGLFGIAAAALLALKNNLDESQWPGHVGVREDRYLIAAALIAYLAGSLAAWGLPTASRASWGHEAACGIVAAAYALAGFSKLSASGLGWLEGRNLSDILAERCGEGGGWLLSLRRQVASRTGLCAALAAGTLLLELGGISFLWPAARPLYAALAIAMHLGIALLMGINFVNWIFLLIALAFFP